jgi:hypothetical protein
MARNGNKSGSVGGLALASLLGLVASRGWLGSSSFDRSFDHCVYFNCYILIRASILTMLMRYTGRST